MLSSATSRAIVPATIPLQLRISTLRLSTRCYAKPSYEPAQRHTGGSIPRQDRGGWGSGGETRGTRGGYQSINHTERRQDPRGSRSSGYNGSRYNSPDYGAPRPVRGNEAGQRGPYKNYKPPRVGRNMGYEGQNYERQDTHDQPPPQSQDYWLPPMKKKSTTAEDSIVPQLSQPELRTIFSQELFVFRCDLSATQVNSAMFSYPQLRDVNVLTPEDISNVARQLHTRFRLDRLIPQILPHIETLIADIKSGKAPGHPLASVHIISCLKEMEEFTIANEFWKWLEIQDETHTDGRVYGAVIECFAYQGESLELMEGMYSEALDRYSNNVTPGIARDYGKGTRLMLFQGIITARLLHGDWAAAYEGFDTCVRLYPTLTPPRIYELIIYERPVKEGYIVFLMACRAGSPPKGNVLTPLLKQLWGETGDVKAMIRVLYAFVGAGGKTSFQHLNTLIAAVWGSVAKVPRNVRRGVEWDQVYKNAMGFTRGLIAAFGKAGVPPSLSTFNTIITLGGKLERLDLVYGGLKEMAAAGLVPSLVTYRVILNAFGELEDAEAVVKSWKDLCGAKLETAEAWDHKDLRALVRACVRTSQTSFCRSELERLKYSIGHSLYRTFINSITREEQKIFTERLSHEVPVTDSKPFPISPSNQREVQDEIKYLDKIFSSDQIHNFASSAALSSLFGKGQETVVDIDSTAPSFPEIPQTELQKFYDTLTSTASSVDIGEDPLQRTATGYSVRDLRFENWRSVNRLLYEAELHEQEQKEIILRAAKKKAVKEGVVAAEAVGSKVVGSKAMESKDKGEVRKLFANEQRAKARIEKIRKGLKVVEGARDAGGVWRKEELRVRGQMGGELEEPLKVSDVVVP